MTSLLPSTTYFILLALATEPLHGTAIRNQIVGDTLGCYLHDGTLYAALNSLLKRGFIEEVGSGYRRTYKLTAHGRQILEIEVRMHKRAVELAAQRLGM